MQEQQARSFRLSPGQQLDSGALDREIVHLINAVSTNKTDFFREPVHYEFIRDVVLPSLEEYRAPGFIILIVEAFAVHEPWLRTRYNDYGELLRDRLALGGLLSSADYFQAVRRRKELCVQTAAAMADVDLLLTTASPTEAAKLEGMAKWGSMDKPGFTMPFNLTGLPAISVCSGFGAGGLPVSIQLVGKAFQEPTVFRAAHAYETATAWRQHRPAMAQ